MVKKIYKPTIPIRTVNGTAWPRLKGVFPRLIFVFSKVCVFDFVVIINRVSDSSSPPHQFISTGQSSWNRNDWAWWRYAASKLDFCFPHLYCNVFHFRLGLNLIVSPGDSMILSVFSRVLGWDLFLSPACFHFLNLISYVDRVWGKFGF